MSLSCCKNNSFYIDQTTGDMVACSGGTIDFVMMENSTGETVWLERQANTQALPRVNLYAPQNNYIVTIDLGDTLRAGMSYIPYSEYTVSNGSYGDAGMFTVTFKTDAKGKINKVSRWSCNN